MNDTPARNLATWLPLVTGSDGQPYISCLSVLALLEYCATTVRITGLDGEAAAELLDTESAALNVRAIHRTLSKETP
ncbi:hypothetical protein AB0451_03360 [Streptomyces sp. NPDC052000]|uniref:hypothetical protein n=1 Tax=Streptomyces sp. NPDC052000 TaxID=3155676 RepID=UPI00344C3594